MPNIVFGVGALLLALFVLQRVVPIYGTIWLLLLVFVVGAHQLWHAHDQCGAHPDPPRARGSGDRRAAPAPAACCCACCVPLLAPTLLYAWLWIALLTFRELTLAVLLTTRDNITLPVVVWSLWLNGGLGQASALALVMLLLMMPIIALYWCVVRRRGGLAPG